MFLKITQIYFLRTFQSTWEQLKELCLSKLWLCPLTREWRNEKRQNMWRATSCLCRPTRAWRTAHRQNIRRATPCPCGLRLACFVAHAWWRLSPPFCRRLATVMMYSQSMPIRMVSICLVSWPCPYWVFAGTQLDRLLLLAALVFAARVMLSVFVWSRWLVDDVVSHFRLLIWSYAC